jgi:hypothetical protein
VTNQSAGNRRFVAATPPGWRQSRGPAARAALAGSVELIGREPVGPVPTAMFVGAGLFDAQSIRTSPRRSGGIRHPVAAIRARSRCSGDVRIQRWGRRTPRSAQGPAERNSAIVSSTSTAFTTVGCSGHTGDEVGEDADHQITGPLRDHNGLGSIAQHDLVRRREVQWGRAHNRPGSPSASASAAARCG